MWTECSPTPTLPRPANSYIEALFPRWWSLGVGPLGGHKGGADEWMCAIGGGQLAVLLSEDTKRSWQSANQKTPSRTLFTCTLISAFWSPER